MQTLNKYFAPTSDSDSDDVGKPFKSIKNKSKCQNKSYFTPFSPQWILQSDFDRPNIYTSYLTIQSTYLDSFEEYPAVLQPVEYSSTYIQNHPPIMSFNCDDSILLQTCTSSKCVYFYNSSILSKIHSNPLSNSDDPISSSNGLKVNYNINDIFWSNKIPSQLNVIPERSIHYNSIDLKSQKVIKNKFNFKDKTQEFIEQIKYYDDNSIFVYSNKNRVYMNDLRINTMKNNWLLPAYEDFPLRYNTTTTTTKLKLIGCFKYNTNTLYCCTNFGDCMFYDLRILSVTPFTSNKRPNCLGKISLSNLYENHCNNNNNNNNNNNSLNNDNYIKNSMFKGTMMRIYSLYEINPYYIYFYLANGSIIGLYNKDLSNIHSYFYIDYSDKIMRKDVSLADGVYSSVLFDRNNLLIKPVKEGNEYYQVNLSNNRFRERNMLDYTCHFSEYDFSTIVINHKENLIVFNENGKLHLKCL